MFWWSPIKKLPLLLMLYKLTNVLPSSKNDKAPQHPTPVSMCALNNRLKKKLNIYYKCFNGHKCTEKTSNFFYFVVPNEKKPNKRKFQKIEYRI